MSRLSKPSTISILEPIESQVSEQPQANISGRGYTFNIPQKNGNVSKSPEHINQPNDLFKVDSNGNVDFVNSDPRNDFASHAIQNRDYYLDPLYDYNELAQAQPVAMKIHRKPKLDANGNLVSKGYIEFDNGKGGFDSERPKQTTDQPKEVPQQRDNEVKEVKQPKVEIPDQPKQETKHSDWKNV